MKKALIAALVFLLVGWGACFYMKNSRAQWDGVDKTVVEKFAEQAGRAPWSPLINTDRGDVLLFVFLIAGTVGGFLMGYYYRALFSPKNKSEESKAN